MNWFSNQFFFLIKKNISSSNYNKWQNKKGNQSTSSSHSFVAFLQKQFWIKEWKRKTSHNFPYMQSSLHNICLIGFATCILETWLVSWYGIRTLCSIISTNFIIIIGFNYNWWLRVPFPRNNLPSYMPNTFGTHIT